MSNNFKVLVTGSRGFTGMHLLSYFDSIGVEYIPFDVELRDREALQSALIGLDFNYVVHLAGVANNWNLGVSNYYDVNLVGTINLLESLRQFKSLNKILIPSTSAVYSSCGSVNASEESFLGPSSHYGASKLCLETVVKLYVSEMPIIITRPFNYTGIGQNLKYLIPKICYAHAKRNPVLQLGNISVKREFNDVYDVVRIYHRLLLAGFDGQIYNVCSGNCYSIEELLEKLSTFSNFTPKIEIIDSLVRNNESEIVYGDNLKLLSVIGPYFFKSIDTLLFNIYNSYSNNE